MKILSKRKWTSLAALTLFLSTLSLNVFAYPYNTAMSSAKGFENGSSRHRQIKYYQYGDADWSDAVDHGVNQINDSSAAISCYYTDSYNDANIVVSSNYWPSVSWSGQTAQKLNNYSAQKIVKLNSSQEPSNWLSKGIVTHELCHVWGVNDCENGSSIECGYDDVRTVNSITSDVTSLFEQRYN